MGGVPTTSRATVAVGPAMPGWGSWEWVGADLLPALGGHFATSTFEAGEEPEADVVLLVKHPAPVEWVERVARRSALVYCPVDYYEDASHITADAPALRRCARILIHCAALRQYFASYAPVDAIDHHVKFAAPPRRRFVADGPLLWVGVRTNLPPLVDWVNAHPLPGELVVLSNFEDSGNMPAAADLGFRPGQPVRVDRWSAERQIRLTAACRAALDVKGDDFRARHKPPAKAVDFLASGVPLALNPGGSAAEYLAGLGFRAASPRDEGRWLSQAYWEECRRVGRKLRRRLTLRKVAARLVGVIETILRERASVGLQSTLSGGAPAAPPVETEKRADRTAAGSGRNRGRKAMERNDEAAMAAARGDLDAARVGFVAALKIDPDCAPARHNLDVLSAPGTELAHSFPPALASPTAPARERPSAAAAERAVAPEPAAAGPPPVKVVVVSFLFNWPSTGGGIVHTVELCKFLADAGYSVRHVHARFDPWGIGRVAASLPAPSECLAFTEGEWTLQAVLDRFRRAVDAHAPDYVIVTDSWNVKPLLADALRGHRVILRLQGMECLCPLNNVRLLPGPDGRARQCPRHQLATADECHRCLAENDHTSGDLHRAERALCGVGTPDYDAALRRAFRDAEAVLVVNPLTEALVSPFARSVRVVTAGMDPARFPWPWPDDPAEPEGGRPLRLLFAGLVGEWMKGFHVLRAACAQLWQKRRDFELLATADPPGQVDEFTRYVGWLPQDALPRQIRAADVLVMPTVAQEGLGRTAVEAMACGRPVVASRIGGLPATVLDGATGLLCTPDDPGDLARALRSLLDDAGLRRRLGEAGRRRFEEHYAWPVIIERHYRPLLRRATSSRAPTAGSEAGRIDASPALPSTQAPKIGCVLAAQDKPPEVLERVLQTYAYQTVRPADAVLLDYASTPDLAKAYAALCRRYGWRYMRAAPAEWRWYLAAAYNLAVDALRGDVEVVFKGDADVLLGPNVLEMAARLGAATYCLFRMVTAPPGVRYPAAFSSPDELQEVFAQCGKSTPCASDGQFACPVTWFRRVGGFDLEYRSWGYEDHDLRWRAQQSIGVAEVGVGAALLVHQWHPPAADAGPAAASRDYFDLMRAGGPVVRNGAELRPQRVALADSDAAPAPRVLVGIHVRDRVAKVEWWLRAWHRSDVGAAKVFVIHSQDRPDPVATHAVLRHRPDYYLPRAAADRDDGAFQEMVGGTFDAVLPPWDLLLWCADSFLPLRGDFLDRFLTAAADPRVALVTGRSGREAACMTGLLIKKEAARRLNLSAEQPPGPGSNPDRGSGWLEERVRGIGYLVTALDDPDARIMWDTNRERCLDRWPSFHAAFGPPGPPAPAAHAPTFQPAIPDRVDQARLQDDVAALLGLPTARAMALYRGYRALHDRERYAERLGEFKTLCFEEAYVLYALLAERRLKSLVAVGSPLGRPVRRLLDMRAELRLGGVVTAFDPAGRLEHVRPGEAELSSRDVTGRFRADVLGAHPPGLVFLDAHAYPLLREAVAEILADAGGWVLALHDCGRGLCNPRMAIARDDPNVSSLTGVWERHVLGEAFGVADPLDPRLDATATDTHRLRVFDTPHGMAIVLPM